MQKEISELVNLINNKNIDKAYSLARNLYQKDKNNRRVINILSYLYIQRGQFNASIDVLETYYQKFPLQRDFDYFINMGVSLKSIEEFEKSLVMYEKAKKIDANSPLCYIVPAEIYLKIRDFNKALEFIDIALNKSSLSGQMKNLYFFNVIKLKTEINVALNQDKNNEDLLSNLIKESFSPDIFYLLALNNPNLIDNALLEKAEQQLQINETAFKHSLDRFWYVNPLYFGLAIAYSQKDKLKSEHFYNQGNNETMKTLRYNSFDYQKQIGNVMSVYQNYFSGLKKEDGKIGANNFFILGSPRSGTTLIESFIGSNDEVISGGELLSGFRLIDDFMNNFKEEKIEEFKIEFVKTYLSRTNFLRKNYLYIVDKLPENFLYIGMLLYMMPQTKIIRTFRDPWDVAISLYKQRYVMNIPYSASFFNIGVFLANFEAINLFWNEAIQDKENILDVYYEDLVDKPEEHQIRIYEFLGLKSEFSEEKRRTFFSQTASIRQIGSSVYKNSVKKQEFLDKKQEFYDAIHMQRKYWQKKGINYEKSTFFGYELG